MAAPGACSGAGRRAALLRAALVRGLAEPVSEPTKVAFDVRPGGVEHSFSQNVGRGQVYVCVHICFPGGTNEQWQVSLGASEDHQDFTCTVWRPQGKSCLYCTQFQAEVRGAEIEYAMACSKAAFERERAKIRRDRERRGHSRAFAAELPKLAAVATAARSELWLAPAPGGPQRLPRSCHLERCGLACLGTLGSPLESTRPRAEPPAHSTEPWSRNSGLKSPNFLTSAGTYYMGAGTGSG
uniref:myeloid-derived growth factor-like n=1 Tax=Jaculus jaculus TaxID=51337 RepID=UPI001E1B0E85|nr:myeloid-derived growth factor-like [Jaculus jaculus]